MRVSQRASHTEGGREGEKGVGMFGEIDRVLHKVLHDIKEEDKRYLSHCFASTEVFTFTPAEPFAQKPWEPFVKKKIRRLQVVLGSRRTSHNIAFIVGTGYYLSC